MRSNFTTLTIDAETLTEISLSTILLHEYSTEHISTSRRIIGTITPTATPTPIATTLTDTITVYPADKSTAAAESSGTASSSTEARSSATE